MSISYDLLDRRCPPHIRNNGKLPPLYPYIEHVDKIRVFDGDVVQQSVSKIYLQFQKLGLIDDDAQEESFRKALDSEENKPIVRNIQRQTVIDQLRLRRIPTGSKKQKLKISLSSAMTVDPEDSWRYVSLDAALLNAELEYEELKQDWLVDPDWENPFDEAELEESAQQTAEDTLHHLYKTGTKEQKEAILLMQQIAREYEVGGTLNDSVRARLKRLRKSTGWPLKTTYLRY